MIPMPPVLSTAARAACAALPLLLPGACALPSLAPPPPLAAEHARADMAFTMPDGAVLPVRTWLPGDGRAPRMAMLALHGMNDSRDAWELPGPALARAGIAVYGPDQRGFGAAPGRGRFPGGDQLVADAAEMLRQIRERHPGLPVTLMGESMGGAVSLVLLSRPELPQPDATVLVAPAVWGRAQVGVVLSTGLWLVAGAAPGLYVTGREVPIRIQASDNRDALLRLARDPLTLRRTRFDALKGLTDLMDAAQHAAPQAKGRVLAMYGARDDLVPRDAVAATWRLFPPSVRRAFYPAGYHLLLRDKARDAPTGDILSWLDAPDAWLPSGADSAAGVWLTTR